MSDIAIRVENLSKRYQLGADGSGIHRFSELLYGLGRHAWQLPRRWLSHAQQATANTAAAEHWALRDVSFEVKEGEVVGIIGRNGAGKSTLLKILSRITEPTSGRFGVKGRVASLLEVGTGFHPELTGRENIYLSGTLLGMTRAEIKRHFDEIVAFAEIDQFLDTPVKRYSSGMYVRLGFAIAAHLQPEILIVDEVLAVGDAQFQKKCLGKMGDVAKSGRTVLFVSHNMTAVRALCHQAIILQQGRLTDFGLAKAIVDQYLHESVGSVLERNWSSPESAPGSQAVKVKRVAVVPCGQETAELTITLPFRLEIDYWVLQGGITFNPSVVLQLVDGTSVLNTCPSVFDDVLRDPLPVGLYRSVCQVPGGLLNDELYRVQLYLIRDRSKCDARLDDLLTFELHDDTPRQEWYGKWIGAVRPHFRWDTLRIPHQSPTPTLDSDNRGSFAC